MKGKLLLSLSLAGLLVLGGCSKADNSNNSSGNEGEHSSEGSSGEEEGLTPSEKAALVEKLNNITTLTLHSVSTGDGGAKSHAHKHAGALKDSPQDYFETEVFGNYVDSSGEENIFNLKMGTSKAYYENIAHAVADIRLQDYYNYLDGAFAGTYEQFLAYYYSYLDMVSPGMSENCTHNNGVIHADAYVNQHSGYSVLNTSLNQVYSWETSAYYNSIPKYESYGYKGVFSIAQEYIDDSIRALNDGAYDSSTPGYYFEDTFEGEDRKVTLKLKDKDIYSLSYTYTYQEEEGPVTYTSEAIFLDINSTEVEFEADDPFCEGGNHYSAKTVSIGEEGHMLRCSDCGAYYGDVHSHIHEEGFEYYCPACESFEGLEGDDDKAEEFYVSSYLFSLYKAPGNKYVTDYYQFADLDLVGEYSNKRYGYAYNFWNNKRYIFEEAKRGQTIETGNFNAYPLTINMYEVTSVDVDNHLINGASIQDWLATSPSVKSTIDFTYIEVFHNYIHTTEVVNDCMSYDIYTCEFCDRVEKSLDVHHNWNSYVWYFEGDSGFDENVANAFRKYYYKSTPNAEIKYYGVHECAYCHTKEYVHVHNGTSATTHDASNHVYGSNSSLDVLDSHLKAPRHSYVGTFHLDHHFDESGNCVICGAHPVTVTLNTMSFEFVLRRNWNTANLQTECPVDVVDSDGIYYNAWYSFTLQSDGLTFKSNTYVGGYYFTAKMIKNSGGALIGYEVSAHKGEDSSATANLLFEN